MQFTKDFKEAIRAGRVSCSFRTWKAPQAKVGGRYNLHPAGAIEVTALRQIRFADADHRQVEQSGFADTEALRAYLNVDDNDLVYLVEFRYLGEVTVRVPPRQKLNAEQGRSLADKLTRMDRRSSRGPWAHRTLALIYQQPGTRAADLASVLGWDTAPFKVNVRKLKHLGLTLSLDTGYRLTDRGVTV
ncbi:MAG: hypothetical protein O7B25_03355, partial [Gammaproteobacteria bacterium]|nr:hypothetical protein [Gammaproteobacteria bacterium]